MEQLARRYLRPAYAVALAVVRNVADAEDVAQESLMTSLQLLDRCRDPARFAPSTSFARPYPTGGKATARTSSCDEGCSSP